MRLGRRAGRVGAQQRDLERRALRRRHAASAGVEPVAQVDQRRERQLAPRRRSAARTARASRARRAVAIAGLPERRLADPRPAREHQRARPGAAQELGQRHELEVAADDVSTPRNVAGAPGTVNSRDQHDLAARRPALQRLVRGGGLGEREALHRGHERAVRRRGERPLLELARRAAAPARWRRRP